MANQSYSRRTYIGVMFLFAALLMYVLIRYVSTLPSPVMIDEQIGDAIIKFSVDRTLFFSGGECATIQWDVENIREIYFNDIPSVGQEIQTLCLPDTLLAFSTPALKIKFVDDTWQTYAITVHVLEPILLYTVLPFLFAAAYAFQLHDRIPVLSEFMQSTSFLRFLREPFTENGRVSAPLVYVFILINLVVLSNAIRHNPRIAYDESGHRLYVETLAQGRLPDEPDTYEFFSPPFPYVFPAVASLFLDNFSAMKVGQFQNVLVSLGITFYLLKICGSLRPENTRFKLLTMFLLAMLPVYYKTMAFMRGEQWITVFALFALYELLLLFQSAKMPSLFDILKVGVALGLMILSRQWAGFIVVAIAIWILLVVVKGRIQYLPLFRMMILVGFISALVGGWFYLSLNIRYGSFLSFNRNPKPSLEVPAEFFMGTGDGLLFSSPYGLAFPRQFFPVFYSETWGDYQGYFFLSHTVPMTDELLSYMGRVNLIALIPSAVFALGLVLGLICFLRFLIRASIQNAIYALLFLCVTVSMIGYLWFVAAYPNVTGDTIKATYLLQIFPLLAVFGGEALLRLRVRHLYAYRGLLLFLAISLIHNLPVFFTRHIRI